jgi:hypothetical protein
LSPAMSDTAKTYSLAPAGYLLLQDKEEARRDCPYRREFGIYFGVDRMPLLAPPIPAVQMLGLPVMLGIPEDQSPRLSALIDEWLDSRFGPTGFIAGHDQAVRLLNAFDEFGYRFELVYCQVAWQDEEKDRLGDYPQKIEALPAISLTYGFDVSWPSCNHSAIFQPGVVPTNPLWRGKLNEYGLLNAYKDAVRLRTEYLAVYPHPPFDVFLVHHVSRVDVPGCLAP